MLAGSKPGMDFSRGVRTQRSVSQGSVQLRLEGAED
jgi:hypothetical protein